MTFRSEGYLEMKRHPKIASGNEIVTKSPRILRTMKVK